MDILSKGKLIMCIALMGGMMTVSAMAQNAASAGKIGCFSIRSVYASWNEKKIADEKFKPAREKLEDEQSKLVDEIKALDKKKNTMASKDYKAESDKLKSKSETLRKEYTDFMKKVQDTAEVMSEKLDKIVDTCVKQIADKEGYSLILDSRSIYYIADTKADITDKVIEYVNNYKEDAGPDSKDAAKPAVKK
jgi:outer membrane protein